MKLAIDTEKSILVREDDGIREQLELFSPEAFALLSQAWLRTGWGLKYTYTFTWMGRPIIQLPEDMMRAQEVIYAVKPDVIIETGVAHGGSLIFYASLCKAMERGRVIGIDIEIRPHNRKAIEEHELAPYITLIEGSSTDPEIVATVKAKVQPGETTLVILDSNHTKAHVLGELNAYADMISPGSYLVATDGIMKEVIGAPGAKADWGENNPYAAAQEFVRDHPEYSIGQPEWPFDESRELTENVTHWPGAWLRRRMPDAGGSTD
jgi:cephalosporin hydroxylase